MFIYYANVYILGTSFCHASDDCMDETNLYAITINFKPEESLLLVSLLCFIIEHSTVVDGSHL